MIKYHGTPFGGTRDEVAKFLCGRHALIPFGNHGDIGTAAEVCETFMIDNGAFTSWTKGIKPDWNEYIKFVETYRLHPGFDFCVIPDVIDGDETQNNQLMDWFCINTSRRLRKSPVWHMHESVDRLKMLCDRFETVCLGSSGEFSDPGNRAWWGRMDLAMRTICDEHGRPPCKLHGLRMLDPAIFSRIPLSSADSTNACRNSCSYDRFGIYAPPHRSARAAAIAMRIEIHNSPAIWVKRESQKILFSGFLDNE